MTRIADNPWFKYPVLGVLSAASAYVLLRPRASAPVVAGLAALVIPIGVYYGAKAFAKWEPYQGTVPFLNEVLEPIAAPKMPPSLPKGFDPVKAKFFKGQSTGKLYASIDKSGGNFTVA